jgi:hypothetical protein
MNRVSADVLANDRLTTEGVGLERAAKKSALSYNETNHFDSAATGGYLEPQKIVPIPPQ